MKLPFVGRKAHEAAVKDAIETEFRRVSALRAEPLTRGWAADLNYEVFHADNSRLRGIIQAALTQAAGAATRPGVGTKYEGSFREVPLSQVIGR